ncbi:MAG TPA: TetR/AcrR family transcriptional regulator [Conexibacter sp.]|jgi:AcrR family transcriptional regulator
MTPSSSTTNAPERQPARPVEQPNPTRDALTAAGLERFASAGYAGARLADIAREAGLTTGAFYRHFANKQAFFHALFAGYGDALQSALNRASGLREQIEAWITVSREYRGAIRAAAEIARPDTEEATAREELRNACASLLARHLQGSESWRETRGAALLLIDILDQYALMEAAGWIELREPPQIAAVLVGMVEQGLYDA